MITNSEVDGSNQVLRIGIVGLGAVARTHLQAYRRLRDIAVVAVADNDSQKVALAAQEFGLKAYSSAKDMLAHEEVDIVCVLTPPATHETIVTSCAAAGSHVLCEKPLALSVESCERMIATCRDHGVRLCYGASYRYLPAIVMARNLIANGSLGEVLVLREFAVGGRGERHRRTLPYSHYPKGGPGGSGMGLCDHGIHLIDIFSWLLNSPVTRVCGRGNVSGEPQRSEFLHLQYENGAIGELLYEDGTFSTDLPQEGIFGWGGGWSLGANGADATTGSWQPHPGCMHVYGTKGSLRIFYYANQLFCRDERGIRQLRVPDQPFPENFSMQLEAFANAIRTNGETPVAGEVGLETWRTLQRVYSEQVALTGMQNGPSHTALP